MSGRHARDPTAQRDAAASGGDTDATPRVVTSEALLRGERQLAILHEETLYFLRRTRFGKLILTK